MSAFVLVMTELQFDEKSILMYYHTTLRNVGLYTSVSLALLGYSRFYRGRIFFYNVSFILLSLCLLILTIYKTQLFVNTLKVQLTELQQHDENYQDKYGLEDLLVVPQTMVIMNSIVLIFGVYTMYREIIKK